MFVRLLLTALLAVTLASAQRGGGGGRRGGGGGGTEGGGFPMGGKSRFDIITETLKLNKEQKKDVKATMDEGQKEAAPVRDQLAKARLALGEAIQGAKGDEEIKKLTASIGALEAQMAQIELQSFTKIYKGLETEQRPAGQQGLFPMMKGIFSGKNWNWAD